MQAKEFGKEHERKNEVIDKFGKGVYPGFRVVNGCIPLLSSSLQELSRSM